MLNMDTVNTRAFFSDDTVHILPTFLRVEEEMRSALDASPRDVLFGRKIFTFPQVIARIYEEIPGVHTILSPPGQLVLIESILHRCYKDRDDGYFMPLMTTKSLSSALINIINNMKYLILTIITIFIYSCTAQYTCPTYMNNESNKIDSISVNNIIIDTVETSI